MSKMLAFEITREEVNQLIDLEHIMPLEIELTLTYLADPTS